MMSTLVFICDRRNFSYLHTVVVSRFLQAKRQDRVLIRFVGSQQYEYSRRTSADGTTLFAAVDRLRG